jgi:hypothetical protein
MYLFAGVSFIGGYVIHGWVEVETVLVEDAHLEGKKGLNVSDLHKEK